MKSVYLLTGRPGVGKTTLIRQAIAGVESRAGGFYTDEIREQGVRRGFRLVTLDGREAVLARTDFPGRYRVGKYGVDIESLERVGVDALRRAAAEADLVVVDEIGKMELLSREFAKIVTEIIGGGKKVLGTVMLHAEPRADAIKAMPGVRLVTLTGKNNQEVLAEIRAWLRAAAGK